MRTKYLIVTAGMCAIYSLPYSSCILRKHRLKSDDRSHERRSNTLDSKRDDCVFVKGSLVTAGSGSFEQMMRGREDGSVSSVDLLSEKVTRPFEVKGETFRTSITANWVLDTAELERKHELSYFDMDNPTLKARIYSDTSGKLQIEIRTKDRRYQVPVDRVKLHSSNVIHQKNSIAGGRSEQRLDQRMARDSLARHSSAMKKSEIVRLDERYRANEQHKVSSRIPWLPGLLLLLSVAGIAWLAWRFKWLRRISDLFRKGGGKHV